MKNYYIAFVFILAAYSCSLVTDRRPESEEASRVAKVIFRSTDGGESWQDIGAGLPDSLRLDTLRGNNYFVNEQGLFVKVGNGVYHTNTNAATPYWTAASDFDDSGSSRTSSGSYFWGVALKKMDGTNVWSPVFEHEQMPGLRSVFETEEGAVFIATNKGLIKTPDDGKTWRYVFVGGLAGNLAESNGVLLSTSMRKLIRSTDNGEHWEEAPSEDAVAWDVKPIKGGFVAITSTSESGPRRLSTSYDEGRTWQSAHSSLRDSATIRLIGRNWNDRINDRLRSRTSVTSVIKVGDAYYCTHRDGIFKSSDKGKTWKLLLPTIGDRGFNIISSGNSIYAVRSKAGC